MYLLKKQLFSEKLNSEYLPTTADELLDLYTNLPEFAQFQKCVSKGLQNDEKNSLLPVFIIPGLGLSRINPLISKIMHPVFCARFPIQVDSVENAALSLLWVNNLYISLLYFPIISG